mmetsp:Transcript_14667/g.50651  ORF Transcript_14667/g.50651 Transcript_14667/m.50651 type:complete len:225 (-) Transcript_14667:1156-1830(-)
MRPASRSRSASPASRRRRVDVSSSKFSSESRRTRGARPLAPRWSLRIFWTAARVTVAASGDLGLSDDGAPASSSAAARSSSPADRASAAASSDVASLATTSGGRNCSDAATTAQRTARIRARRASFDSSSRMPRRLSTVPAVVAKSCSPSSCSRPSMNQAASRIDLYSARENHVLAFSEARAGSKNSTRATRGVAKRTHRGRRVAPRPSSWAMDGSDALTGKRR